MTPTETNELNAAETPQSETPTTEVAAHDHTHDHDHDHDHAHHHHDHGPVLNPDLTREISVEAPVEAVDAAFDKVVRKFQKQARIPGFRPGKVPANVIKRKFAQDVRQEVMEQLVSERFRLALEEQNVNPVSQPQIVELTLFEGQPLKFKAAFEVLPEIDITGYDSVKVAKPSVELTEEEYQSELDRALDSQATIEPVTDDRTLTTGDLAEISFTGEIKPLAQTVGEEGLENVTPSEPITGEDVPVELGGKNTLPAFSDALQGKKPGDELTLEVEYPADFGEPRLAGKTVSYDVKVKAIKKKTLPEQNDELAKQLGDYETWDEFTSKLREHASDRKKHALENEAKEKLVEELIAKFEFPVPESFVQQQIDARLDRGLRALAAQGMKAEDMRKLDFVRLRAAQRDQAVSEVKASLILDKIAATENVEVSDEDVDRELLILSIQSREPLEQLKQRLTSDGGLNRIREQLRREKTGNVLYDKLAS
ncbi:trigger factor [Terriglobus albidus]|uniref:trigger factor n=1 Tax=Terriglobus albidus TaxID=1592106 RepID=UPI001FE9AFEF|nr:trigger factor [Terriglobus albidus]